MAISGRESGEHERCSNKKALKDFRHKEIEKIRFGDFTFGKRKHKLLYHISVGSEV